MKLIMAIMNSDDSSAVQGTLMRAGYKVTTMQSTGVFLMKGNTTLLIGTEEDKIDAALDIIKQGGHKRTQVISSLPMHGTDAFATFPIEVTVGGATVFVLDVDRFEKY